MKKLRYHILFLSKISDVTSKGIWVEAETPQKAIDNFEQQYPTATFLGLYIDNIKELTINCNIE